MITDGALSERVGDHPRARRYCRIVELTHTPPAEKVFEVTFHGDKKVSGNLYTSHRLATPYPPGI